jgi:predicted permease
MTFRYAWRSLAKSKGFVAIAVLALGVGLGLSTTMFGVMDAALHPFVAYKDPATLFGVNWWFGRRNPMQPAELYRLIRDNTQSFAHVVPVERFGRIVINVQGAREEIAAVRVSPRYFPATGVAVARGRVFGPGDGPDVAIVSAGVWRRLYGARRDVRGATVRLNDSTYAVVGVLPNGWSGSSVILPIAANIETDAIRSGFVRPMVRLRPGVTRETAANELKRLAGLLTDRFGAHDAPFALEMYPSVDQREEMRDIQKAMIGAALLVLLIACVNLAHLMLARGLAKRRELALRLALGATRATVVRQMFAECAMITAAGAGLGALIAVWGAGFLRSRMPQEVRWIGLIQPQLSWRVFALATAAAAVSALLFGLVPAVRVAFGVDVNDPLKDDTGTTTGRVRHRYNGLVISEVALALVLLMGGGLLLRTVYELQKEDADVNTRTLYRVYTFGPDAMRSDSAYMFRLRADVLETLRASPGVVGVALSSVRQPAGGAAVGELTDDSTRQLIWEMGRGYELVTPEYLTLLGLPILRGRNFEAGDMVGPPVAIIDPLAAEKLYPRQDPVGHMIKLGRLTSSAPWVRIIGVARSPRVLASRDRDAPPPSVFVVGPPGQLRGAVVIRAATADLRFATRLQTRLRDIPGVGSTWVQPFDWERQTELVSRAFLAKVFVAMGAVALGLAALGLYGVLAYTVNRRMREFAVRIALGAEAHQLRGMVLHDGAVMLLAGTGVGAFVALAASRYLDAVLVSVLPSDVFALVISEAVLLSVGFAAALAPARRAARANPLDIMRAV